MSGSVYSNNKLGMLTLNSTRHEPFDATITVKHKKGNDLGLMKAQLGTIVDFYRHNLEPSFLNSNLSFRIKDKNDYEKIIHVTSEMPISAENFGFVVRLYDNEEKSFGVYKFIPPVVDPMEDVEMVVCNRLNWDRNKSCMKAINTAITAERSIVSGENETYASSSSGTQIAEDIIDFNQESGKGKKNGAAITEELLNKKELSKLENNKGNSAVKKAKKLSNTRQEESKNIADDKTKKENTEPKELNKNAKTSNKETETAALKKERARLRKKLKPHMYQAKNKLPDYHSDDADEIRDNLKPKIAIKQNKKDSISKGIVKFSEILKVDQAEEKK